MFVPSQCLNFTLVCLIKLCTLGDLCLHFALNVIMPYISLALTLLCC